MSLIPFSFLHWATVDSGQNTESATPQRTGDSAHGSELGSGLRSGGGQPPRLRPRWHGWCDRSFEIKLKMAENTKKAKNCLGRRASAVCR